MTTNLTDFNWIDYRSLYLDNIHIKKFHDVVYYHFNQQNLVPLDFDWIAYKSLNLDLNHITCYQDAIKHYKLHGIKESRPYRFNDEKPNENINLSHIEQGLLHSNAHQLKGFHESTYQYLNKIHSMPYDFDWMTYKALNADLTQIKSYNDAVKHYKEHGNRENRKYKLFNNNNEIKNEITVGTISNLLPADFDWKAYISLNDDLMHLQTLEDASRHYLEHGHKEKRQYNYPEEDTNWYQKQSSKSHSINTPRPGLINSTISRTPIEVPSTPSIINTNTNRVLPPPVLQDQSLSTKFTTITSSINQHIAQQQINQPVVQQPRIITSQTTNITPIQNVNVPSTPTTLVNSSNLQISTKKDDLPYNFDWLAYKSLNHDLTHITCYKEAIKHYKEHGCKENRPYKLPYKAVPTHSISLSPQKDINNSDLPSDYNWVEYRSLHPDLKNINDYQEINKHYLEHGKRENRKYTETPGLNKKSTNLVQLTPNIAIHVKTPAKVLIFDTPQKPSSSPYLHNTSELSDTYDNSNITNNAKFKHLKSPRFQNTPKPPRTPTPIRTPQPLPLSNKKPVHLIKPIRSPSTPIKNQKTPIYTPKHTPKNTTKDTPTTPIKVIRRPLDYPNPKIISSTKPSDLLIPNLIHFVYGFKEQTSEFALFKYIAIKSAIEINKPHTVYFHYKYEPYGPWWNLIKPYLKMVLTEPPTEIFGNPIKNYAHQSDVVRLKVLNELGGIYLDIDTICLRPLKDFMKYDFVMGIQGDNYGLCNAIMLAKPGTTFGLEWFDCYKTFNDNDWDHHSVRLPLILSKKTPITILANDTFFYPLWEPIKDVFFKENLDNEANKKIFKNSYCIHLWESYTETELNLVNDKSIFTNNTLYNILARKFIKNTLSIVMLTYNRPDKTIECINSFLHVLNRPDIEEFIIHDNASHDVHLLAYLKNLPNINSKFKIIYSNTNLGVSGGRARLFSEAKGSLICSLDSDLALINPQFFDIVKNYLYDESIGMIGVSGAYFSKSFVFGSHKDVIDSERTKIIDTLAGCCHIFRNDLKYFGVKMDLKYGKFWVEDSDFAFQIREFTNKNMLIVPQKGMVNHSWGGTGNDFVDLFKNNWDYFTNKWQDHKHLCSI